MDLQIDTYGHGLIDGHLWAWTYRQTLMGMDLQRDTYGSWTYRYTLMIMDLQIDIYGHGVLLGL